jgi:hypothetical protein
LKVTGQQTDLHPLDLVVQGELERRRTKENMIKWTTKAAKKPTVA